MIYVTLILKKKKIMIKINNLKSFIIDIISTKINYLIESNKIIIYSYNINNLIVRYIMINLLVGNGINMEFDKASYAPQQIVLRILKNCDRNDFPSHIIVNFPYLLKNYIGQLYLESRKIILGEYENFTSSPTEKKALEAFNERYSDKINTLRITDIGFEDYYLIHDLLCHKTNMQNPEQFYIREAMRISYLYSIYNDGKLNQLYLKYPEAFIKYLSCFDSIFTTNYDSNIESATGKEAFHLHGQFDKKSDVYIESSFRNQLPDTPIKNIEIDENYFYLYSNALSTYSGAYKEFQIKQSSQANSCIEKMAIAYNSNPKVRKEINSWIESSNTLTENLGYAIQLKASNPFLTFPDNYHFDTFKSITGTLEILGLSPWNDFHIFESVNSANLDKCIYYFYEESECDVIKNLLPRLNRKGILKLNSVKLFWSDFNEK